MKPRIGYFYVKKDYPRLVSVTAVGPNLVAVIGVNNTLAITYTLEHFSKIYKEYNP